MTIIINDTPLQGYLNNDFMHIFNLNKDITNYTYEGYIDNDGTLVYFDITKSGTTIILSLTKAQINTIGVNVLNYGISQIENGFSTPYIKGSLTIKSFV